MKKILILTAAFGNGHLSAARNLRDALDLISEDSKVEILDLPEQSYGLMNSVAKKAYLSLVRHAPAVWGGIYSLLDRSASIEQHLGLRQLKSDLEEYLNQTQPDVAVSTYPLYASLIQEIYRDHAERPFRFITVVTDSISINAAWFRSPSDLFCVPNDQSAEVLRQRGISNDQIRTLGFPVHPQFAEPLKETLPDPAPGAIKKLLYIVNTGKIKAARDLQRLLAIPNAHITVAVGRDPKLKARLMALAADWPDRITILGWTNDMPRLMRTSHLTIAKAGGATVQECIAAKCPLLINQIIPGQEEGNARLVSQNGLGAVAPKPRHLPILVESAFANGAQLWHQWRSHLAQHSRPDAALRLAELILEEAVTPPPKSRLRLFETPSRPVMNDARRSSSRPEPSMLLCDFHIHTNYSDGQLTVPEVIDFYGRLGFDCIAITDHLADPGRLLGRMSELASFTLGQDQIAEYFDVLERERRRAWHKYGMLVMTGIEFNKDGYTSKSSAHLLGIGLEQPVDPRSELPELIASLRAQDALAVASHPHRMKSEWGKNTLHLWDNQKTFAPLLDAWEIANRNNLFNPVGLKRLPFIANSDFHKPKHIFSWKTLLYTEKDPAAVKDCIRKNRDVAITLFRDLQTADALHSGRLRSHLRHESLTSEAAPCIEPVPASS